MNILEHAKYTHVKSKDSFKVAKILGLFLKVDTFIRHGYMFPKSGGPELMVSSSFCCCCCHSSWVQFSEEVLSLNRHQLTRPFTDLSLNGISISHAAEF